MITVNGVVKWKKGEITSSILDYVENEDITSEQLAELDIKIKNDASLENKVAVAQQKAIIDKNLDPSISKEKRNKLW